MPDKWDYTPTAHSFAIFVGKANAWKLVGSFQEVSGLTVSAEPETFREGGENQYEHKRPGRISWPNLTLKRGVTKTDGMFEWFARTAGDGYEARRDSGKEFEWAPVQIALLTKNTELLRSWGLERAFPVKWTGPTLAAASTNAATEELEVAHHGFTTVTY